MPSVNQASNPQVGTSSGRSSAAQSSSKESATKTVRPTIQTASTSNSGDSRFVLWGLAAVTAVAAVGASRLKSVQKAPKKLFKTVKANIPTSTGRFAWTQLPKYQDYLKDSSFNRVDKITFKVNGESTTDLRIAFVGHTVNKKQAERIQNLVNQAISNNPALLKKLGLVAVFSSEGNKSINTSLDSFGVLEIDINALSNPSEVFDALAPGKFVRTHDVVEFEAIDADCQDPRIKRYENEARGIVAKYVAPAADTELEVPVEPQRIHRVPYTRPPDVISGYSTEEIDHDPAPQWPAGQSAYFSHTPPSPEELAMVPRFMRAMQQGDDLDGRPL